MIIDNNCIPLRLTTVHLRVASMNPLQLNCALMQLWLDNSEHCTGSAEVSGSNPVEA